MATFLPWYLAGSHLRGLVLSLLTRPLLVSSKAPPFFSTLVPPYLPLTFGHAHPIFFFSHLAPPSLSHLTPPIPFSHHPPTLPQSSGWAHALLVICFQSLFPVIWLAFWSAGETLQGLVEPLPGPALDGATEDCGRV